MLKVSEKKFFWIITIIIVFITLSPFLIAQIIQASSLFYYTGVNLMAGGDKPVYFSYIEQARQGQWLFKNLYTSEPQQAILFSPLWLIIGKLALIFNVDNIILFQLFRTSAVIIFLYLIYQFLNNFFPEIFQKRLVFIFLITGLGFGLWPFLILIFSQSEVSNLLIFERVGTDFWISESNIFLTIFHSPLFILSQIIILVVFWLFLKNLQLPKIKYSISLFFLTLFLGITHPYDLVIINGVLLVFLIAVFLIKREINWWAVFDIFLIGLASLISLIYFFYIFSKEIALKGWAEQNVIPSPPLLNYICGYGLFFIFFLFGLLPFVKQRKNHYYLLVLIWAVVQLFLLYSPVSFQTKLSNGLHLPLGIIAGLGFFWLIKKIKQLKIGQWLFKKFIFKILIIQLIVFLLWSGSLFYLTLELYLVFPKELPIYLTVNEKQAALWLRDNLKNNEVILARDSLGNLLPALTARTSYLGHGHQTINWDKKLVLVAWFFDNNQDDKVKGKWLKDEGIDYLFFDKLLEEEGKFKPLEKDYLQLVYQNPEVKIFKVK